MQNLERTYDEEMAKCSDVRWILVGYSQGAQVVAEGVKHFAPDKVIFVMLMGDPETNLPEGNGLIPDACLGRNLSTWREFAPNCYTAAGIFGERKLYEPPGFEGKFHLWCNRHDYICGSAKNPFDNAGHTLYASSGEIRWGFAKLALEYLDGRGLTHRPAIGYSPSARLASVRLALEDNEQIVYAVPNSDEYVGIEGEEILFDASQSFNVAYDDMSYYWFFSDGVEIKGRSVKRSFAPGDYEVELHVYSWGIADKVKMPIRIADMTEVTNSGVSSLPEILKEELADATILTWDGLAKDLPKFILVRLNGVDLGYVDMRDGRIEIRDMDMTAQNRLVVFAMAEDGELGDSLKGDNIQRVEIVYAETPAPPALPEPESILAPVVTMAEEITQTIEEAVPKQINEVAAQAAPSQDDPSQKEVASSHSLAKVSPQSNGLSLLNNYDYLKFFLAFLSTGAVLFVFFAKKK